MTNEDDFFFASNTTGEKFFTKRRNQLSNAKSEFFPETMALFSELIQNSDDANSKELVLGFSKEGIYISNDGFSFNMGATRNSKGEYIGGDLESLSDIGERKKTNFVDKATGMHGTGFELIYYISNRFEVHWYNLEGDDRENGKRAHISSMPEQLAIGQAKWKYGKRDDSWLVKPLFMDNEDKTRRGVTFKAPWRSKKDKEVKYGNDQPFSDEAFVVWDNKKIENLYKQCSLYLPYMFQFCKNLKRIEIYLMIDENNPIKSHSFERSETYQDEKYCNPKNRSGSELIHIKRSSMNIESSEIWSDCKTINPESQGLEMIRAIKFGNDYTKNIGDKTEELLEFVHFWGPVNPVTKPDKERLDYGIDKDQVISFWRSKNDISRTHICYNHSNEDIKNKPSSCYGCVRNRNSENWKLMRSPVVHINLPLFDVEKDLDLFHEPGKTFISSIMPLAMLNSNRFFVSGDFHVNETRKEFMSESRNQSIWNRTVANSIFEVIKSMYGVFEDTVTPNDENKTLVKFLSLNSVPTKFDTWFNLSNLDKFLTLPGYQDTYNDFLFGRNDSIWYENWVLCNLPDSKSPKLISPDKMVVPLNKQGEFCERLSSTLLAIGLNVIHQEMYERIFSASLDSIPMLKNQLNRMSPFASNIHDEAKIPIKEALLSFETESMADNQNIDIKILAELSEHFSEHFNDEKPKTYADANGIFCRKQEFVKITDEWSFFTEMYSDLRTIHPELSQIVKLDEMNIEISLKLFEGINLDLEEPETMDLVVQYANKVLESEESPEIKREVCFIPCKYRGEWMLRPDNHLEECTNCKSVIPFNDFSKDGRLVNNFSSGEIPLCATCGSNTVTTPLQGRSQADIQSISRSMIFTPTDDEIPEIIKFNLFVSHPKISGRNIRALNCKTALISCSSINSKKWPSQVTLFNHKLIKNILGETNKNVTEKLVQDTIIELLTFYSQELSGSEPFNICSDLNGNTYAQILFDEKGDFYDHNEFILHISDEVRDLLMSDEEPLRALHKSILNIESIYSEIKNKSFHWLANENTTMLRIKKNVDYKLILNAIDTLLNQYSNKPADSILAKLSEIVMMILKSSLQDKNKSLLSQIKNDQEAFTSFSNKQWVPLGQHVGLDSPLAKWDELYVPNSKLWGVWGTENQSRQHEILYDSNNVCFTTHQHFSEESWQWLLSNGDEIVKKAGVRPVPSANRMIYTIFNNLVTTIYEEKNLETIFSKELFALLNEITEEQVREIKSVNDKFTFRLPTRDKVVENPHTFGTTADYELSKTIYPADKKSVPQSWIIEVKKLLAKLGLKNLWDSSGDLFDQYFEFCTNRFDDVDEKENKFLLKILKSLSKHYDQNPEIFNLEFQQRKVAFLDRVNQELSEEELPSILIVTHMLPGGKGTVYSEDDVVFFDKDDEISNYSDKFDSLVELKSSIGGIFTNIVFAKALIDLLGFKTVKKSFASEFESPLRFKLGPPKTEFTRDEALEWNQMVLSNTDNLFSGNTIDSKVEFAVLQVTGLVSLEPLSTSGDYYCYDIDSHPERITNMILSQRANLIVLEPEPMIYFDGDDFAYQNSKIRNLFPSPEIQKQIVKGAGTIRQIEKVNDYMKDIHSALEFMSGNADTRLGNWSDEWILDIAGLSEINVDMFSGNFEIKNNFKNGSVNTQSSQFFVKAGEKYTISEDFERLLRYSALNNPQEEALYKIICHFLDEVEHSDNGGFIEECKRQVRTLVAWPRPLDWPLKEEKKLGGLWDDRAPQCETELILNPKKREATQTLLDKYLHRGCNICNKRTPNEPGRIYNFEEKKITLIKEKATRYVGQDDNTTGNMLYLCPNHAHSYSKKCVKIVLQLEDGTWKEISDIKEKIDSKKFSYSDLRVEVWEGKSSDGIDWDDDEDNFEPDDEIAWNLINIGNSVKHGWIQEDHAKAILSTIVNWVNLEVGKDD